MSNPNQPSQDPNMITGVPGMDAVQSDPNAVQFGTNIPLEADSPTAEAFQMRAQRALDAGSVGVPEYMMPEGADLSVPELPAVGTPDKVLSGPRETGSYTRPDGITVDSRVVGGAKETRIHGMGSQHNLPQVPENPFTRRRREAEEAQAAIDAAAVRHPATPQNEAMRQMDIAAADRKNRDAAGLPPRTHDLR